MEEKLMKTNIVRDQVGEKTDLSLCPECPMHADCFASMDGKCTALKTVNTAEPCVFYKSTEENLSQARRCYQRLKDTGRTDLINKYIKALSAMGLLDDEIREAERYGDELDAFQESNYQALMDEAISGYMVEEDNGVPKEENDGDENSWDDGGA